MKHRKFVLFGVVLSFSAPAIVHAFGLWVGGFLFTLGLGSFIMFGFNRSGSTMINPNTGNPYVAGDATWVDLNAAPGSPNHTGPAQARMNFGDLKGMAQNNSNYPNLSAALSDPGFNAGGGSNTFSPGMPGDVWQNGVDNGKFHKLHQLLAQGTQNCGPPVWSPNDIYPTNLSFNISNDGNGHCNGQLWSLEGGTVPKPSPSEASPGDFASAVNGDPGKYQGELDGAMKNNPGGVKLDAPGTNGASSGGGSSGIQVPTNAQIADYLNRNAGQAGQNAGDAAQSAYSTARAIYGDGSLQAALAAARLADEQARAAREAARKAEEAKAAEDIGKVGLPADNSYDGSVTQPEKKSIAALLASWAANSPLGAMVRSFSITTGQVQSSVEIGDFYGRHLVFDFNRYSSTFSVCGGVLLVICHGFAVLVVMRGW